MFKPFSSFVTTTALSGLALIASIFSVEAGAVNPNAPTPVVTRPPPSPQYNRMPGPQTFFERQDEVRSEIQRNNDRLDESRKMAVPPLLQKPVAGPTLSQPLIPTRRTQAPFIDEPRHSTLDPSDNPAADLPLPQDLPRTPVPVID